MPALLLETGIIGVFLSLNLFLFYVFWEAALIPMYFLIGMLGRQTAHLPPRPSSCSTRWPRLLLMLVGDLRSSSAFARAYRDVFPEHLRPLSR
ncbi:MAG: hypothetical protein MZV70_69175 [Desulfobacterales bacterium]|nr:hypothetical protein [Desulfobacterales bacterium]